jgi:hypothetical protein
MRINFAQELKTLSGETINKGESALKLSHVCCDALFATFEDEKNLSGDEKAKRFVLATKIYGADFVDLSPEDVVVLKKLVGKAFSALIVGQAYQMFDPKPALAEVQSA